MELKFGFYASCLNERMGSNRTFMELKFVSWMDLEKLSAF